MKAPLISIIIVTFNAAKTIDRAIQSVITQVGNTELIVIDGGSTDETPELVAEYGEAIRILVSEPDRGIYDAMNKAIDRSNGKWLYFLGADDQLQPDSISSVNSYLNDAYVVVFGSIVFDTGQRMQSYLGRTTLLQNTLHHQSAFYHRSLFATFRYDINLRTLADYELNLLIYIHKLPTRSMPIEVALCQAGGASSDWSLTVKEANNVRRRYLQPSYLQPVLSALLYLYYAQKTFRRWLDDHSL